MQKMTKEIDIVDTYSRQLTEARKLIDALITSIDSTSGWVDSVGNDLALRVSTWMFVNAQSELAAEEWKWTMLVLMSSRTQGPVGE